MHITRTNPFTIPSHISKRHPIFFLVSHMYNQCSLLSVCLNQTIPPLAKSHTPVIFWYKSTCTYHLKLASSSFHQVIDLRFTIQNILLKGGCHIVIFKFEPLIKTPLSIRSNDMINEVIPRHDVWRTLYNDHYPFCLDDWSLQRGYIGSLNHCNDDISYLFITLSMSTTCLDDFPLYMLSVVYGVISRSTGNLILVSILLTETPCSKRYIIIWESLTYMYIS